MELVVLVVPKLVLYIYGRLQITSIIPSFINDKQEDLNSEAGDSEV